MGEQGTVLAAETRPPLLRIDHGAVARLTLDRPASRNSLSEAMMSALVAQLDAIAVDATIKVVVIAAKGPVFCAGHDLKEISAHRSDPDRGRAYFAEILGRCARMMTAIVRLPQPVIAEVGGVATAAGCQFVASCDLAIASEEAKFCTPGVAIGLFCSTPMVALSRDVAPKHAMEMLLTADMVSAARAAEIGLVNRVVPAHRLTEATTSLAASIAARSRLTVRTGKKAFYAQAEMTLDEAYAYASSVMVENMLARDAEEGIGAFIEKRQPTWEDR
jgi:enoyl-CoA hydratase/carnithine racemase